MGISFMSMAASPHRSNAELSYKILARVLKINLSVMYLTGQRGVFRTSPALRHAREIPVNLVRYALILFVGASGVLHVTGDKL